MARIQFSEEVDSITGKIGGTVFQNSYGGYQVRTRQSPRNPRTGYQQLRRGRLGNLSATWRTLTTLQRQSFIDAAPVPGAALNLYNGANTNLDLINEPRITDYIPSVAPDEMPIEIITADTSQLEVQASGMITEVPTGTKLLIYTTGCRPQTHLFITKSAYSPIVFFDEGTALSSPVDIFADFTNRYGDILPERLIGLKSVLIDKTNGQKGPFSLTTTITTDMASKYIPLAVFTADEPNTTTGSEVLMKYTMPANTLVNNGDRLRCIGIITGVLNAAGNFYGFSFDGNNIGTRNINADADVKVIAEIIRTDVDKVRTSLIVEDNLISPGVISDALTGINFTSAIDIGLNVQSNTTPSITCKWAAYDKIAAP